MTGEVVNLRRERKRKARQAAEAEAAANRSLHGVPKTKRTLAKARAQKERQDLETRRLDVKDPS